MTTSHFDALEWMILGLAVFLLVDGLLTASTRRGLVDRILPGEKLTHRLLRAAVYFLFAGILFYSVWRG